MIDNLLNPVGFSFSHGKAFGRLLTTEAERDNPPQSDTFANTVADNIADIIADVVTDTVTDIIAGTIADAFADGCVENGVF